jgi:hypothetical protein
MKLNFFLNRQFKIFFHQQCFNETGVFQRDNTRLSQMNKTKPKNLDLVLLEFFMFRSAPLNLIKIYNEQKMEQIETLMK